MKTILCMARYDTNPPQILRVKGQNRIIQIYKRRGFVEVSQEEYQRLLQILRRRFEKEKQVQA